MDMQVLRSLPGREEAGAHPGTEEGYQGVFSATGER